MTIQVGNEVRFFPFYGQKWRKNFLRKFIVEINWQFRQIIRVGSTNHQAETYDPKWGRRRYSEESHPIKMQSLYD